MSSFKIISADEVIEMLKGRHYRYGQVHHTYSPDHADFTGDNHIALQQGMYNYHVHTRGWQDIGQHLTLFPDGMFVTGRDFDTMPAGISGWNTGSFMIEHIGNFDKGHDKLTGEQLKSSLKVYNYLINHCGSKILFHREHAVKSCPGTGLSKPKYVKSVILFDGGETVDIDVETEGGTVSTDHDWVEVTGDWTGQTLGRWDYGEPVRQLQTMLAENDPPFYPNKSAKNNGIDSYYGDNTEDAVTRYQTYYGLDMIDGLAGQEVYGSLTGSNYKHTDKSSGANLVVDGKWGESTNEALQVALNTTKDGVLSGQVHNSVTDALYGGVEYGGGGSLVIEALQRRVGAGVDGLLGPGTVRALQDYLGTPQDGVISRPSSKVVEKMQKRLNAGTF